MALFQHQAVIQHKRLLSPLFRMVKLAMLHCQLSGCSYIRSQVQLIWPVQCFPRRPLVGLRFDICLAGLANTIGIFHVCLRVVKIARFNAIEDKSRCFASSKQTPRVLCGSQCLWLQLQQEARPLKQPHVDPRRFVANKCYLRSLP